MNDFVIASFYTINTPYEKVIQEYFVTSYQNIFKDSKFIIKAIRNYGNWYNNVAHKPQIVLELLEKLDKHMCLVLLDADAEILKYPKLFEEIPEEYDIAFHYLDWNIWYGYNRQPPTKELLTGTMFFRNNDTIKALCDHWYKEAIKTHEWEQKILQRIINLYPVKIYELPLEYCYMKSTPKGEPIVKLNPVILHHQVSRELKRRLR